MGQSHFREAPAQTRYPENKSPFRTDKINAYISAFFVTAWFVQLVLLPSFKLTKKNLLKQLYVALSIFVCWTLLATNYSYCWRCDEITTKALYKPYSADEIHAKVGAWVGLRGVNVTLEGLPRKQTLPESKSNETIFYNEEFSWAKAEGENRAWDQGRFGFGIFSGNVNQQFRVGQFRGQPWPIQQVAEWFTVDGETIRWGRWYRIAGYYTHILLWTCFPIWFITNVVLIHKPFIGGIWLMILGLVMVVAVGLYANITEKAQPNLTIPFEEGILEPNYGWPFYLLLVEGIVLMVLGPIVMYLAIQGHIPWDTRIMAREEEDEFQFGGREDVRSRISNYLTIRKRPDKALGRNAAKYIYARPPRRKRASQPAELVDIYENTDTQDDRESRMYLNVLKNGEAADALPNYQNMEFAKDPNSRRRQPAIPGARGVPKPAQVVYPDIEAETAETALGAKDEASEA